MGCEGDQECCVMRDLISNLPPFQVLNEFFHNVCELDLVFNFYKVNNMSVLSTLFACNLLLHHECYLCLSWPN